MKPEFWHERWQQGQTAFHLAQVNPNLARHGTLLAGLPGCRVLVPLCGKSFDMVWLAQHGHRVVGVELSALAVQAFFHEQKLVPQVDAHGPFTRHRAGAIEILCGDLFALDRALLGEVSAYYDRAALVAFPPEMRPRYAQHITSLLPVATAGLLVSFEYLPPEGGPPFNVPEAEVRALYEPGFELSVLERHDLLQAEPRFKERGIHTMHEVVYSLQRR